MKSSLLLKPKRFFFPTLPRIEVGWPKRHIWHSLHMLYIRWKFGRNILLMRGTLHMWPEQFFVLLSSRIAAGWLKRQTCHSLSIRYKQLKFSRNPLVKKDTVLLRPKRVFVPPPSPFNYQNDFPHFPHKWCAQGRWGMLFHDHSQCNILSSLSAECLQQCHFTSHEQEQQLHSHHYDLKWQYLYKYNTQWVHKFEILNLQIKWLSEKITTFSAVKPCSWSTFWSNTLPPSSGSQRVRLLVQSSLQS